MDMPKKIEGKGPQGEIVETGVVGEADWQRGYNARADEDLLWLTKKLEGLVKVIDEDAKIADKDGAGFDEDRLLKAIHQYFGVKWKGKDEMGECRKPKLRELRPGDVIEVTNKDNDVSTGFIVDEIKLLWVFPVKVLYELSLYADTPYPLSYLNRKEIHWKIRVKV